MRSNFRARFVLRWLGVFVLSQTCFAFSCLPALRPETRQETNPERLPATPARKAAPPPAPPRILGDRRKPPESPQALEDRLQKTQALATERAHAAGLASGSFGVVKREVQADGSVRAIKSNLLTADEMRSLHMDPRAPMLEEAALLKKLHADGASPWIPEYFGIKELPDGTPAVVKEWVDGSNKFPSAPLKTSADYFVATKDALAKMRMFVRGFEWFEKKGYLVLDGKLENVVFRPGGQLVFVDLGSLTKISSGENGAPVYARPASVTLMASAPEAVSAYYGLPHEPLSVKSDLYSAGFILSNYIHALREGAPPKLSAYLDHVEKDLVEHLQQQHPSDRYGTEQVLRTLDELDAKLAALSKR